MLMRYPPINEVELLVSQAIYLRDHLSIEGGKYIIQQNAIRSGKSIIPQPLPVTHPRESSNINSRIEGFVPDGLVHATKNVLDTVNTAMLNKAISSVVGEVKVSWRNMKKKKIYFKSEGDRLSLLILIYIHICITRIKSKYSDFGYLFRNSFLCL